MFHPRFCIALSAAWCLVAAPLSAQPAAERSAADQWRMAQGPLATRWAKQVSPDNVHPEYPRPQMVRSQWQNLNGLWDYAIPPRAADGEPERYDGKILVPFPVESALSGVMKEVGQEKSLWCRRLVKVPAASKSTDRLLLHFGAVDWHAVVWVNGQKVGEHKGGYSPFTFDITDALADTQLQKLVVRIWDPTDQGFQPRGKQVAEPRGIWYTSVTGIWRTVWTEWVPATHIRRLKITPDLDRAEVRVDAEVAGAKAGHRLQVEVLDQGKAVGQAEVDSGKTASVKIAEPKPWSPDSPHLYDLKVQVLPPGGEPVDAVASYVGLRKIEIKQDIDGFNRIFLNNQPLFQYGPLDQGWWPDGLYTAPTDKALRYDIEVTKRLGMNMCRKHVKVEPDRWYYWCDKLGLLVWQDMPNGDRHIRPGAADINRSAESAENYRREYREMIDSLYNHPCIVTWVPFNEGWGQFETDAILAWTKKHDPTRLVDGPSGWTDRGTGDMHDIHRYPGPAMPPPEADRAVVLGEFGGLGWPVEEHLWWNKRNWGYRTYHSRAELEKNYLVLMQKLQPLIARGLAAAIYTQTTDVEGEVNGLMTYDRELLKFDAEKVARIHKQFYQPPPLISIKTVVPTSEKKAQTWNYTFAKPAAEWMQPDFDDDKWKSGPGGFGEPSTPGAIVRTDWKTNDIWLRRAFEVADPGLLQNLHLRLHHDEDVEVFINGQQALALREYTTGYIEVALSPQAAKLVRRGRNTLAIHCRQTAGGQYIDAGLLSIEEKPR